MPALSKEGLIYHGGSFTPSEFESRREGIAVRFSGLYTADWLSYLQI